MTSVTTGTIKFVNFTFFFFKWTPLLSMVHEGIKIGLTQKMRAYSRSQVLKHLFSQYVPGSWHESAQRKLAAKRARLGIESWIQVLFLLLN